MTRVIYFLLFLLIPLLIVYSSNTISSPKENGPILFLSNETGTDLSKTILYAIDSATESIYISIYNLSDKKVISALNKKAEKDVLVHLYTDAHASWPGIKNLHKSIQIHLWKKGALMHQKILVIDRNEIYFGSANFSWNSLNLHRNLILAFKSKEAANFLLKHLMDSEPLPYKTLQVCGQETELLMLPSKEDPAKKVTDLIQSAKKCIKVAMYTWTRSDFAGALANAKLRGINVQVILDRSVEKKAPNPVIDTLKKARIETHIYQGPGLLHHKFLWIDDETLLCGSANWTLAAFKQNRESYILLNKLKKDQKVIMNSLWDALKKESRALSH